MHSPRVGLYFNNIGPTCTDSLRRGNGLSALLLLTRAPKSSAAKNQRGKTRSIGLYREIAIAIQKESGDSNGGNV